MKPNSIRMVLLNLVGLVVPWFIIAGCVQGGWKWGPPVALAGIYVVLIVGSIASVRIHLFLEKAAKSKMLLELSEGLNKRNETNRSGRP